MAVVINAAVAGFAADTRGTLTEMNALTGVAGQSFFNTTYNHPFRWINNRWVPMGSPDPRYGFVVQDEFVAAVGVPWTAVGSVSLTSVGSDQYGSWTPTQASASARSLITQTFAGVQLGSLDLYFEAIIKTAALATVSEDYCITIGFNDNTAFDTNGACTDGVFFQYNRSVTGDFWGTRSTNNSTQTANTSTIAVAASTIYRLGIVVSGSTSAKFYVNGVKTATDHTANLPTGAGRQTAVMLKLDKTAGTGANTFDIDYVGVHGFFASARVS